MRTGLLATWLLALSIIGWDEIKRNNRVPQPQRFIAAGVVWAILGVVADFGAPEIATILGIGFILSMLYTYYNSQQPGAEGTGTTGEVPSNRVGEIGNRLLGNEASATSGASEGN